MDITGLIIFNVMSGVTGWLTDAYMKNWSIGFLGNIIIGTIGGGCGRLVVQNSVSDYRFWGGINSFYVNSCCGSWWAAVCDSPSEVSKRVFSVKTNEIHLSVALLILP